MYGQEKKKKKKYLSRRGCKKGWKIFNETNCLTFLRRTRRGGGKKERGRDRILNPEGNGGCSGGRGLSFRQDGTAMLGRSIQREGGCQRGEMTSSAITKVVEREGSREQRGEIMWVGPIRLYA